MSTEGIWLGHLAPPPEPPRTSPHRSNPVTPVVAVREAPARPSHDHSPQPLDVLDQRPAQPADVGYLRIWTHPDPIVDHAADMLGELTVDRRPDGADRLVEQHRD